MAVVLKRRSVEGRKVENRTLTAVESAAKQLTLADVPKNSASVVVDLPNGTVQINGADYEVTGDVVDWDGKTLETVLTTNDKLVIIYS